jgi:hypothetical protein
MIEDVRGASVPPRLHRGYVARVQRTTRSAGHLAALTASLQLPLPRHRGSLPGRTSGGAHPRCDPCLLDRRLCAEDQGDVVSADPRRARMLAGGARHRTRDDGGRLRRGWQPVRRASGARPHASWPRSGGRSTADWTSGSRRRGLPEPGRLRAGWCRAHRRLVGGPDNVSRLAGS